MKGPSVSEAIWECVEKISLWTSEWNYRAGTFSFSHQPFKWSRHSLVCGRKAQGQSRWTAGKLIHFKVTFIETKGRRREKKEKFSLTGRRKQTQTSIKNKWKYLISPFTDWIYIARVCCLVTSHCPAHFNCWLVWRQNMNRWWWGCRSWLFPGAKGERGRSLQWKQSWTGARATFKTLYGGLALILGTIYS